jgi:cytoskeleton protein RodZ
MTDNSPQNTDAVSSSRDDDASGPLAGQRLASARRELDITIAEIAKELHLDEPKVQALEENLFDVLGAPVFAKGHLRKYAELVGVPIDDILADYYKLNRATGAPPVVGPKRPRPPREISPGPWIAGAVAVMLVAGALYWWLHREPGVETTDTTGVLEPFASSRAPETAEPEPLPDFVPATETITAETEQASPAATAEPAGPRLDEQQPVGAATGDQLQIAMTYSGDCWTEVTDANGERLFFGLGQAGQTVTRNGIPPLQALFGNADNVRVTVDGVDFSLAGGTRRGKTARVTISEQ